MEVEVEEVAVRGEGDKMEPGAEGRTDEVLDESECDEQLAS